jgi:hypothetical protein
MYVLKGELINFHLLIVDVVFCNHDSCFITFYSVLVNKFVKSGFIRALDAAGTQRLERIRKVIDADYWRSTTGVFGGLECSDHLQIFGKKVMSNAGNSKEVGYFLN